MMNPHLPAAPHGLSAMPFHPRRGHNDMPFSPASHAPMPSPYASYHYQHFHPHAHSPQRQQWYSPYQHMHMPPPRQYSQPPPMVVSSYPHAQPIAPLSHPSPQPHPSVLAQPQPMPSPSTSTTSVNVPTPPPNAPFASFARPPSPPARRIPFYPSLPWYSVPDQPFPSRAPRRRRKRRTVSQSAASLELPSREGPEESKSQASLADNVTESAATASHAPLIHTENTPEQATNRRPSTQLSDTASSAKAQPTHKRETTKTAVPVVPLVPATPQTASQSKPALPKANQAAPVSADQPSPALTHPTGVEESLESSKEKAEVTEKSPEPSVASPTPPKAAPKSWADLVRNKSIAANAPSASATPLNGAIQTNGFSAARAGSLGEALHSFNVESVVRESRIQFVEPRGLVNTGNMCYMNSVLQILLFCIPFYSFLDLMGKRSAYSFKSDTPLIDAMIMFMREFTVLDSAPTSEQLKLRLKGPEIEQYGEAFIPHFFYETINGLPRFSSMRRGHQQDAEEFLGFLLEGLHDECINVMKATASTAPSGISTPAESVNSPTSDSFGGPGSTADDGWLEVGPKQKSAVTRSSGMTGLDSPVNKIFGGQLRSELRVPGLKTSVTLEPYQPLQLDIGSPQVSNITDALKGLTHSEALHGDFGSPRGPDVTATKQVFIETMPPVLILHLKRFQYDNTGGTQKIWKKVGYPLELEIPKEVFPPNKRGAMMSHGGLPKYRLIGVVYHHGKNASGGHYTVDVRRQDGREWIRLDDTVIRRLRSEDVAEGGSEEDPKVLAAALENHKRDGATSDNFYQQILGSDDGADEGWSQVNGTSTGMSPGNKKSNSANGTSTPTSASKKSTNDRFSVKDNKVAYILFYQRI
ncbi:cysteine proteinase [Xylona heveae TC161]|uniref:Ubiquitin carboxyl-terminal hydrolase n=1 Tax=Xylona heveae (strain CBS 132557 / TC161) TaxID=1328760 RepID=A0A165F936_XYLHT|nr:cysteine proteinase [Xylona heveae TC161]KZF20721.1 cysteine proteinase [Xylona heveae TC161]